MSKKCTTNIFVIHCLLLVQNLKLGCQLYHTEPWSSSSLQTKCIRVLGNMWFKPSRGHVCVGTARSMLQKHSLSSFPSGFMQASAKFKRRIGVDQVCSKACCQVPGIQRSKYPAWSGVSVSLKRHTFFNIAWFTKWRGTFKNVTKISILKFVSFLNLSCAHKLHCQK